jgi:hypothetical protein
MNTSIPDARGDGDRPAKGATRQMDVEIEQRVQDGLFGQNGRLILLGLARLLIAAWALAARFQSSDWARLGAVVLLGAIWLIKAHRDIVTGAGDRRAARTRHSIPDVS